MALPDQKWGQDQLLNAKRPRYYNRTYIPDSAVTPVVDAELRRRWRCLLLAIKAKLEIVESGIATFDEEFLAHIVVDNMTIFDRIREAAGSGRPLLPPVEKEGPWQPNVAKGGS